MKSNQSIDDLYTEITKQIRDHAKEVIEASTVGGGEVTDRYISDLLILAAVKIRWNKL